MYHPMRMGLERSDILPAGIERFVPGDQLSEASNAVQYAWGLLGGRDGAPSIETVATWCYEFAATGVSYWDWPDLAVARHLGAEEPGELQQARRDAMAHSLLDHGENDSVRQGRGMDSQWT